MSKHTPEPWFDDRATHDEPYQNIKILGDENRGICWLWIDDAPVDDWNAEQRANANRIVTCVNACAGMAEPAAEIAHADDVAALIMKASGDHEIRQAHRAGCAEHENAVSADRSIEWRAQFLPVGKELCERAGIHHRTRQNVTADFGPFLDHAYANVTCLFCRQLL